MDNKPQRIVIIDKKEMWCMSCHEFVGTEYELQHVYPEKYPDAMECGKCDPSHFFYYHHCPKCHKPRIISRNFYESFLPLKEGEDVDYCESCDKITRIRENKKLDAWLCEKCFDKPSWIDDE